MSAQSCLELVNNPAQVSLEQDDLAPVHCSEQAKHLKIELLLEVFSVHSEEDSHWIDVLIDPVVYLIDQAAQCPLLDQEGRALCLADDHPQGFCSHAQTVVRTE